MTTSWERVLAAMEAEAARAAALLDPDRAAIEFDVQAPQPVDVPATWRLPNTAVTPVRHGFMTPPPTAVDAGTDLPDPAAMPPLPDGLRDRLTHLHARISALRDELAQAMAEAEEILSRPPRRAAEPPARAELVDRRV